MIRPSDFSQQLLQQTSFISLLTWKNPPHPQEYTLLGLGRMRTLGPYCVALWCGGGRTGPRGFKSSPFNFLIPSVTQEREIKRQR